MIDLRERAGLALDHYVGFLDPRLGDVPWFYARLGPSGSFAEHCEWDFGDATGRYLDAALLCRRIAGGGGAGRGSARDNGIERIATALERMFDHDDGLCWRPGGLSWVAQAANMFDQRSTLYGLVTWLAETGDPRARRLIDGLLAGLRRIVADRGDWAFFPYVDYTSGDERRANSAAYDFSIDPLHYGGGALIAPLAACYRATGDERALVLARKLARFVVERSGAFDADGGFWSRNRSDCDGHVHSRVAAVCGVLEVARLDEDKRSTAWCRTVYDWARTIGSAWGWFPEGLYRPEYRDLSRHSETCCTTDMIDLAIGLARSGSAGCWDHAERFANHLLASQVLDVSWAADGSDREPSERIATEDVRRRYRGAFTGRTRPDDLFNNAVLDTMGCCAAAGGQGLSRLYENALDENGTEVRVNLWTSRKGDRLEVTEPNVGAALAVRALKSCRLEIRAPGWLPAGPVAVRVGGRDRRVEPRAGFIDCGELRDGTTAEVMVDVPRTRERLRVAGDDYNVVWRGNTIAGLERRSAAMPVYPEVR